jgi:hypothetical protein
MDTWFLKRQAVLEKQAALATPPLRSSARFAGSEALKAQTFASISFTARVLTAFPR